MSQQTYNKYYYPRISAVIYLDSNMYNAAGELFYKTGTGTASILDTVAKSCVFKTHIYTTYNIIVGNNVHIVELDDELLDKCGIPYKMDSNYSNYVEKIDAIPIKQNIEKEDDVFPIKQNIEKEDVNETNSETFENTEKNNYVLVEITNTHIHINILYFDDIIEVKKYLSFNNFGDASHSLFKNELQTFKQKSTSTYCAVYNLKSTTFSEIYAKNYEKLKDDFEKKTKETSTKFDESMKTIDRFDRFF